MRETTGRLAFCLVLGLIGLGAPAQAAVAAAGRAIIVVADRVTVRELRSDLPHLACLLEQASVGLLSAGSPDRHPASAYATIGAGARVQLADEGGAALEVGELCGDTPAGALYQRRSGREPEPAALVIPAWPELEQAAATTSPGARPGSLGEAVRAMGLRTALVGNADRPGELGRWAGLLVADRRGLIDCGQVGPGLVIRQPTGPYGVATDWDRLLAATREALATASVVAVETGQTLRADEYARHCTPEQATRLKRQALAELDAFLGRLLELVDPERDLVILLSPGGPTAEEGRPTVAPVVFRGPGFGPGLLVSPATRWPGVVAPTDLAPGVLAFLGGGPTAGMVGRPVTAHPAPGHLDRWEDLSHRITGNEGRRALLLKGYVVAQIAVVLGALVVAWLALPLASVLRPLLLALATAPLAFLVLGALPLWSLAGSAAALVVLTVALSLFLHRRGGGVVPFVAITLATVLVLTADVMAGYRLIRFSPLGYSPVAAFRFYGLGNELMGVYVGACLVGFSGLADLWTRAGREGPAFAACALGLGLVTVVLASPGLGANLGGAVTASVAFSWTLASLRRPAKPARWAAVAAAAGALVVALAAGLDTVGRAPSLQSHIGLAGRDLLDRGLAGLLPTLERKLSINLRLIRYTIWSRVFVCSLAGFTLLFYRPPGVVRRLLREHPVLARGFTGVLLGALVALLTNDSGVVAAATTMIYATSTLGYLALGELPGRPP